MEEVIELFQSLDYWCCLIIFVTGRSRWGGGGNWGGRGEGYGGGNRSYGGGGGQSYNSSNLTVEFLFI